MDANESKFAIFAAIAANIAIAIMKFVASFFTGSAAMLSEGIHSLIDTINGGLLLVGISRSKKAPDKSHPFGYGKESYFWGFVVSIMVFALGGGVALYEGIIHLIHPIKEADHSQIMWNYGVLIGAMLFEGSSLIYSLKVFRKNHGGTLKHALQDTKDSGQIAIIVEESAAVTGLLIALIGVTLSYFTKDAMYDALASVFIGLLLVYVSYFMASEVKSLLVGETVTDDDLHEINDVVADYKQYYEFYGNIKTMHLGPNESIVALEVNFKDDLSVRQMETIVKDMKVNIMARDDKFTYVYIESNSYGLKNK